jgi:hypothetical protein
MGTAETIYVRMREDELLARIRYHEDRQQQAEHLAAFHRAAGEAARNDLTVLQRPGDLKPGSLTTDRIHGSGASARDDSWREGQSWLSHDDARPDQPEVVMEACP